MESKNYTIHALAKLGYDLKADLVGGANLHKVIRPSVAPVMSEALQSILDSASPHAIKSRGITATTARKWGYLSRVTPKGHKEQIAVWLDDQGVRPIAAKVRNTGKDGTAKEFSWRPNMSQDGVKTPQVGLYGKWLWPAGGKKLVITEGELDALTVSQIQDNKWPEVSVPNGAAEAAKAIARDLEYVNSFDQVILMFDMDGPGRDAVEEAAKIIKPGKAFIAHLPLKDPNACLMSGQSEAVRKAIWDAQKYQPNDIGDARLLTQKCLDPVVRGIPWPWKFMTDWTYGRMVGKVYMWGAGTGVGKTDFASEIIASTITGRTKYGETYQPEGFAVLSYEAADAFNKKSIAGKIAHQRFHIPQGDGPEDGCWTRTQLEAIMAEMDGPIWEAGGKLFIPPVDHLMDWESVAARIRWYHAAEGILNFVVEPISALVVGEDDERKALDSLMMGAQLLAVELGVRIHMASHLTRPDQGPSHEEGGQVRLKQFRGSNGIGMSSSFVFGLERNTQSEDETDRTKTLVRVVKDRYTGNSTGKTRVLHYDILAGTLDEETVRLEPGEP